MWCNCLCHIPVYLSTLCTLQSDCTSPRRNHPAVSHLASALLLQEAVNEQGLRPADPEGAAAWDQRRVQIEEALSLHDQTERLQTEGLETAWRESLGCGGTDTQPPSPP